MCNGAWLANVDAVHCGAWLDSVEPTWIVTCGGQGRLFDGETMYDYVHPLLQRRGIVHTHFVPSFSFSSYSSNERCSSMLNERALGVTGQHMCSASVFLCSCRRGPCFPESECMQTHGTLQGVAPLLSPAFRKVDGRPGTFF